MDASPCRGVDQGPNLLPELSKKKPALQRGIRGRKKGGGRVGPATVAGNSIPSDDMPSSTPRS